MGGGGQGEGEQAEACREREKEGKKGRGRAEARNERGKETREIERRRCREGERGIFHMGILIIILF